MSAEIQTERFLFVCELLRFGPRLRAFAVRRREDRLLGIRLGEQRHLPPIPVTLRAVAVVDRATDRREQHSPHFRRGPACLRRRQRIERPRLDQALEHPPVDEPEIGLFAQPVERRDAAIHLAHLDNGFDGRFTDVLDSRQTEANALRRDREVQSAGVDVRRQDRHLHVAALAEVRGHLVGILALDGQQRGHEVPRVVRLQIGRLVRQQRVRCRMALVEAIPGEVLHQVEDPGCLFLPDAALHRAADEPFTLRLHDGGVLLAHRLAQHVPLAHREAPEVARNPHHLFLIGDDAVGVGEDRLELRHFVRNLHLPVLALDEIVDDAAAQRSGPVQRIQRDQIIEPLRLRLAQRLPHPGALELEHPQRLAVAEQLVRLRVVERDLLQRQRLSGRFPDVRDGVVQQRQRAQAEEVHLEQADPFDLLHRPLRGDFVLLALVERYELGQWPRRNDDARGVHRGVASDAFQPARDANQFLHPFVPLIHLLERRALVHRPVERHVERGRNLLRHAIDVGVRHAERPTHIANRGARLHGAESDDLGHILAAVLAGDVLDDLAPPPLAEIDVYVGQRHPFGIEKALEDQVEFERIHIRDTQAVRHQAARRRSASRTDRDAVIPRIADEVPHDKEVAGVAHALDDVDLVGELRVVFLNGMPQRPALRQITQARQALLEPLSDDMLEILVDRETLRHVEARQVVLLRTQVDVAALGNRHRVLQRFREIPKYLGHFLRRLEIELVAVVPQALLVLDVLAGPDAQQHVVRAVVCLPQVVHVVRADQRHAYFLRDWRQPAVDDQLLVDPLVLHFQKKIPGTQDVAEGRGRLDRPPLLLETQVRGDLSLQATA